MKELIDSILKAETEAEKIIADAKEKALRISEQAAADVLLLKTTADEDVKNARRSALAKATADADELYQKRLDEAKFEGQQLIQKASTKTQEVADFIMGRILI